ncbi:MAG: HEAT repeat domain-containing protein [Gammaproteobacteria bacterium]
MARLTRLGGPAVSAVVRALENADATRANALARVLGALLSPRTLHEVVTAMPAVTERGLRSIVWALSHSEDYNPNRLLDYLTEDQLPRGALVEALEAQGERLDVRQVLNKAYQMESTEKAALFRLTHRLADEALVPDLIERLTGKDVAARIHIIEILGDFPRPDVRQGLEEQLRSDNKLVRQAALAALTRNPGNIDPGVLCGLLRDPDINVQNRAVEALIAQAHPETFRHLVEVLKDESEFARRAAVEVLNEIGDARSIKDLLGALGDDDWWVRARATDALARIGGPRVIDAVLELINEKDESVRRAAVEILNTTKDERAVRHLIKATEDEDWWVRERAADALGEIGNPRAVPAIRKMFDGDPRSVPAAIRALARLAGKDAVKDLLPLLQHREKSVRRETMAALAECADTSQAESVLQRLSKEASVPDQALAQAASSAIRRLSERMGAGKSAAGTGITGTAGADSQSGMLTEGKDFHSFIRAAAQYAEQLDITKLEPGDMIENRYKFIRQIGKGAFGTVLLVEDMVVDDRLVLKFLNPNVASDEEMMKRFIHELRFSRKITHRNVIRIYDFLLVGGLYTISMEYFDSHPLSDEMKDEKPLPLQTALRYGLDVATGMSVAHQAGVVHRDLKPANVLINDEGLVKVVDFGVAAARTSGDTQLTRTGYVIGSPKYMAPEQILGKKVDDKADIYSLGVILYEMLTGHAPYTRGDHMSVMYQHVQGKAKPVNSLNPNIPDAISDLVARCMTVDKQRRPDSMDQVAEALRGLLSARGS